MSGLLVVGVSGVTNSGKSTLVQSLLKVLPSDTKLLAQDDYYQPTDWPDHVPSPGGLQHHNWDLISSIDMDRMLTDIRTHVAQTSDPTHVPVLLLDGFVLFDDPRVTQLCDVRLFMTLEREVCLSRRTGRVYDPPDIAGYFEHCVWPMYLQHLARLETLDVPITFLDGASDRDDILHKVQQMIEQSRTAKLGYEN